MKATEALKKLESLGTAQNRKVYARHGVGEKMFGVSYAALGKLKKEIQRDHELAVQLWESGNHDARVLATMIADPGATPAGLLEAWAKDLDSYVLTDAFSVLAAATPHARKKAASWTKSKKEWVGAAGWNVLAHLALRDPGLPAGTCISSLETIERDIHRAKNRVRYAMNNALIAIGIRSADLEKRAKAAARRIGKVEVDHGETGCRTPDAVAMIEKARARKKARA